LSTQPLLLAWHIETLQVIGFVQTCYRSLIWTLVPGRLTLSSNFESGQLFTESIWVQFADF
jgi:hypothetical protein